MTKVPQAMLLGSIALCGVLASPLAAAQAAPVGEHPRIWLDAKTRSGIQAQAGVANSPITRAAARCAAARENPADYAVGGWQGFEFVTTLSSCLAAYVATGGADDLATSIKYFRVLLDDYSTVGDGLGGDDVVTHDTGYAMRTFAPFAALAYDWLHDAPGVTEELRAHARGRFDAWSTFYSTKGYLRHTPGANYHAGYVFAATLIAIAEANEAGAAGDAHWANVRDVIWKQDVVPAFAAGQVLDGGDWPEGWQYGSLSVLELSLAARALQANGMNVGGASDWASSLPLRFVHGLTPTTRQSFTGGDSDAITPYRAPDNGALLAALAGPASEEAKALARKLNADLQLKHENPLFDALAAASGEATLAELPATAATNYLAPGTGNWYVRGAWAAETAWSVFQCARHLVDDHQYSNAGNWVLTRGADDVVVDPSPYGSLSTLTGNAPAVDSASLPEGYSPSQGYWGKTSGLVWTRQSSSGVAAARCDYADQFQRSDVPSDVSSALRDFVMLPSGDGATVVLVDRVVTGSAERGLHLRVRTPAALVLAGDTASGAIGGSSLAIRTLWSTGAAADVRVMPKASECPSSSHTCDVSKLESGSEYRVDVAGPAAFAIHAISAQTGVAAKSEPLSGSGYRGALITRGSDSAAVIVGDAVTASLPGSLTYRVPANDGLVHVVLDAPVDSTGQSDVNAVRDGADCVVEVKPHAAATPGIDGRPLVVRMKSDCAFADDGEQAPVVPGGSGGAGGSSGSSEPSPGIGGATISNGGAAAGTAVVNGAAGGPAAPGAAASNGGCALRPSVAQRGASQHSVGALVLLGLWGLGRRHALRKARSQRRRARP